MLGILRAYEATRRLLSSPMESVDKGLTGTGTYRVQDKLWNARRFKCSKAEHILNALGGSALRLRYKWSSVLRTRRF